MKLKYTLALGAMALFALSSCDGPYGIHPEGNVQPGKVVNVTADNSKAGHIILHWERQNEQGQETLYTRVKYFDPYQGIDVVRFGSFQGDSVVIPKTWAVAGEYKFELTPISPSEVSGEMVTFTATAKAVEPSVVDVLTLLKLKVEQITTNAKETSEGSLEALVNGNENDDYFHSDWHGRVKEQHYLQVDLSEQKPLYIRVGFQTRRKGGSVSQSIKRIRFLKSKDGQSWEEAGTDTYPKATKYGEDIAPSTTIEMGEGYTFLRIFPDARWDKDPIWDGPADNKVITGQSFFHLSELYIYDVYKKVTDFEAEAKKKIDSLKQWAK